MGRMESMTKLSPGLKRVFSSIAIGMVSLMIIVCAVGIGMELMNVPIDWKKIGRYISFGLPFSLALAIMLGSKSAWYKKMFPEKDGRGRLLLFLIGIYLPIRFILWWISN